MFRLPESHLQGVSHNCTCYLKITSIRSSNSICHIVHHIHFCSATFVHHVLNENKMDIETVKCTVGATVLVVLL